MHAQRAAQAADRHEQLGELRLLRQHLAELVADDQQRGQRLEGRALLPSPLVVAHTREVARCLEQLLPPVHLPGQRVVHAVDQGQVVLQVRDDRRDVRELLQAEERRTALEVDQDEVERAGRVGQ